MADKKDILEKVRTLILQNRENQAEVRRMAAELGAVTPMRNGQKKFRLRDVVLVLRHQQPGDRWNFELDDDVETVG